MSEFIPAEAVIEPHAGPPGNRLYLVCIACPDTDQALMLGKRLGQGYSRGPSSREINEWFERHAECCVEPDHFQLAMAKPANWDRQANAALTEAVKLALVKS